MITEKELLEAIAECYGVRNPNANTCAKLASYYTILDHVANTDVPAVKNVYSHSQVIDFDGESEFLMAVKGMPVEEFMSLMDELMATLRVLNPRLYASVMRKLEG